MISERFYNDGKAVLRMSKVQAAAKKRIEEKIKNRQYLFRGAPCCVCGKDSFEALSEKDGYGLYCPTVICKICGLVQQNPKMSQMSYRDLYNKEYRDLYDGESGDEAVKNYFLYQYARGKDIFNYIAEKGGQFSKKRVFEAGCGAGGILKYFQEQGNEVYGIDLSFDYVKYGKEKGLNLEMATFQNAKFPWRPDIIIYNNVVEHLIDPVAELKELKKIVNEGALLYVSVPNLMGLVKNYDSDLLKFLETAHTFYFAPETLRNVLNRAGCSFLRGDEDKSVMALFSFSSQNNNVQEFSNSYRQTMRFLENAERHRSALTPTKIIFWAKKTFVAFLKKTGLFHWFFQKVWPLVINAKTAK